MLPLLHLVYLFLSPDAPFAAVLFIFILTGLFTGCTGSAAKPPGVIGRAFAPIYSSQLPKTNHHPPPIPSLARGINRDEAQQLSGQMAGLYVYLHAYDATSSQFICRHAVSGAFSYHCDTCSTRSAAQHSARMCASSLCVKNTSSEVPASLSLRQYPLLLVWSMR